MSGRSNVGIYTFMIEATIEVPDDYTMTSSTQMVATTIRTVVIEHCPVDSYVG